MSEKNNSITFRKILEDLLDNSRPFSPGHLLRFSDLAKNDLDELKKIWQNIVPRRRIALMEDLEELLESDTLMCFDDLSIFALQDDEPQVRTTAIRMLWDTNYGSIANRLIGLLEKDLIDVVRATAAGGLGRYIYEGEIENIPTEQFKKVEDSLLKAYNGSDHKSVRRKSLESMGFSSRTEVQEFIQKAFDSDDLEWKISAIFAMGRSADSRWAKHILTSLNDPEPEISFEAIRAAGLLELKPARQPLLEMLLEPENRDDKDKFKALVWSLSQIGGGHVREALTVLQEEMIEEDELVFFEEVLENLSLTEGFISLDILDDDFSDKNGFDEY